MLQQQDSLQQANRSLLLCARGVQNPESGGLVSADRKASLLSCLQHPVSLKSSTMDLLLGA
ncbi:MAG: hypothetical protein Q7V20_11455, partial [Aquabacterium sp.]|uniref:hypothetical protein n=1 Tax=Aquabacterium sp. TaxID=1872578 RepID=UPI0027245917